MPTHAALTQTADRLEDRQERLSDLTFEKRALLNHLRLVSLQCRASARADLFAACAILSTTPRIARTAHAEVLMKCLEQATGRAPVLLRPGVNEISFDEAWLLRATICAARQDWDSFAFLLRSRVRYGARRNLGALIVGVSAHFDLV